MSGKDIRKALIGEEADEERRRKKYKRRKRSED